MRPGGKMKSLLSVLLAAVFLCSSASVSARLGEKEAVAKRNEKRFLKKYGATDPYYQANDKGKIIQECWQAPAAGWGMGKALKFARELIPAKLRKGKAKREKVEGNLIFYRYKNGATIVLSEGPSGIIQLEVFVPGYKGRRC
jgi:hypothetical protein